MEELPLTGEIDSFLTAQQAAHDELLNERKRFFRSMAIEMATNERWFSGRDFLLTATLGEQPPQDVEDAMNAMEGISRVDDVALVALDGTIDVIAKVDSMSLKMEVHSDGRSDPNQENPNRRMVAGLHLNEYVVSKAKLAQMGEYSYAGIGVQAFYPVIQATGEPAEGLLDYVFAHQRPQVLVGARSIKEYAAQHGVDHDNADASYANNSIIQLYSGLMSRANHSWRREVNSYTGESKEVDVAKYLKEHGMRTVHQFGPDPHYQMFHQ